jgi:transcriptional regulator with XRE-family HTH domain
LAARVGIDPMSLSQIERGRQNVTILNLFHIARALELPLSHLIQPLDDLYLPSAPFPTDHSP